MDKCSPKFAEMTVSCFTKDALLKIVNSYNKNNDKKIVIKNSMSRKQIWEKIQSALSDKCGENETCWLKQKFLKAKPELNLEQYFKPIAPLGKYQWLTTSDINNVMTQWEEKYKNFKFVGPVPIDFLNLDEPYCIYLQHLNPNEEAYDYIGIVYNLDPSTKSGSHWVSMSINRIKKEICYFDSYGDRFIIPNKYNLVCYDSYGNQINGNIAIPAEIQKFIYEMNNRIIKGGKKPYTIKVNTIQHQYANSECGVYSMLFILKGRTQNFENITQDIIIDEIANKFRDKLYRKD